MTCPYWTTGLRETTMNSDHSLGALVDDNKGLMRIGYWLGEHAPGWPDVRDFVDSDWYMEARIYPYHYVSRGLVAAAWMGYSECRFCGQLVDTLDLTDGTFVWPEGLAH